MSFLCIPLSGFAKETKSHAPKKYAENKSKKPIKFKCDGRQHCPNTKMDGDNDGIPCEGYKKDR
ncbi:excalibur calcium-binding domain-containing protein [Pseudoalteromonas sp. EB27]|uniref:excalibur calcium-binding domain-containing protein n=1 Tax=Pseudoalteromonas sp. EB27 TaxID=1938368 RepID=UPI00209AFBFA|nr:excalibur calcium-binding domain-containing protein [Pseudoalteromonas sp. EB27]